MKLSRLIIILFYLIVWWTNVQYSFSQSNTAQITPEIHNKSFRVNYVEGDVVYWSFSDSRWKYVSVSKNVPYGSLLKVGKQSKIIFEYYKQKTQLSVELKQPVILRLTNNTLREVVQNSLYLQRFPEEIVDVESSIPILTMEEAYVRTKVFLKNFLDIGSEVLSKLKDLAYVQVKRKDPSDIEIISPLPNMVLHPSTLPHEISIEWTRPENSTNDTIYNIYLWNTKERPEYPLASQKNNIYYANLSHWEGYFIQITSSDGGKSDVRSIFFKRRDLDLSNEKNSKNFYDLAKIDNSNNLQLSLDLSQYPGKKIPYRLSWSYTRKLIDRNYFVLNVRKKELAVLPDGSAVEYTDYLTKRITGTKYVAEFEYGTYQWWIDIVVYDQSGAKKKYSSNKHTLTLNFNQDVPFGSVLSDAIEGLQYQTESKTTIYFE